MGWCCEQCGHPTGIANHLDVGHQCTWEDVGYGECRMKNRLVRTESARKHTAAYTLSHTVCGRLRNLRKQTSMADFMELMGGPPASTSGGRCLGKWSNRQCQGGELLEETHCFVCAYAV